MAKDLHTCPRMTPLTCRWESRLEKTGTCALTALNLSNHRYLLDNSNTFGGTHYVNPREISIQMKYRFHF